MSDLVLVDSSMWVQYFNMPNSPEHSRVRELVLKDMAAVTGVVVAEVLHGARSEEQFDELKYIMDGVPYLETSKQVWDTVGRLTFLLKSRGATIRLPDLIIGAVAVEHGCPLFTRDGDFSRVPGLELYDPGP